METVDNRTWKQKIHEGYVKTRNKVEDFGHGVKKAFVEHPVESFTILTLAVPGVLKCVNSGIRLHQQKMETRYNECDVYDNRTSTHFYTKRPLTNREKLELERRYNEGESKGSILKSFRLI